MTLRLGRSCVGIAGLGLIGGSLGLSLARRVRRLVGYDPSARVRRKAVRLGAVHEATGRITGLRDCDLVLIAAPQADIVPVCVRIARVLPPNATIIEVGSVKRPLFEALAEIPEHVNVLAAHPMAGTEHSGIDHAFAGLFWGRPFVLLPARVQDRHALDLGRELVRALRGREVLLDDPRFHDHQGARLIHLPHLLAYALVATGGDPALAGPSWESATRVARSSPRMVGEMLHANRAAIRKALPDFRRSLARLTELLDRPRDLQRELERLRRRAERSRRPEVPDTRAAHARSAGRSFPGRRRG